MTAATSTDERTTRRAHAVRAWATTALGLGAVMSLLSVVLEHVERRPGVALADPVLARLPAHDFTWLTFGVLYVGFAAAIVGLARTPDALLRAVRAYAILMLLRSATLMLTPLAAPPGMILLVDPLARHFVRGPALTKDLFFSGHTATIFLLFLASRQRALKAFFLVATVVVAVCVLWQHVHYTIDVLAAPPFAYASFAIASRLSASPSRVRSRNPERSRSASARDTDS